MYLVSKVSCGEQSEGLENCKHTVFCRMDKRQRIHQDPNKWWQRFLKRYVNILRLLPPLQPIPSLTRHRAHRLGDLGDQALDLLGGGGQAVDRDGQGAGGTW